MPSKKRPGRSPSQSRKGRSEILLEDMRSQNAATIEAVQVVIQVEVRRLDQRLDRVDERFTDLDVAVRGNSAAIQRMDGNIQRMDAKLDRKADATLVARVEVLERGQP